MIKKCENAFMFSVPRYELSYETQAHAVAQCRIPYEICALLGY